MHTTFSYVFTPGNIYNIKSLIYEISKILNFFMNYEYHDWNVQITMKGRIDTIDTVLESPKSILYDDNIH